MKGGETNTWSTYDPHSRAYSVLLEPRSERIGKLLAADVVKVDSAKTVQGQPLTVVTRDGKVTVNGANVVKADIACKNGVIHVIDAVLLPPEGEK